MVAEMILESYVSPLDLERMFGRKAPLHVDLGCGDGSFLCEQAQRLQAKNFLGIERLSRRVKKACRKTERIDNVRVLHAESSYAVRYLLPENSVETFYILFPDPWPKRRHRRRRIFRRDFLDSIATALEENGFLHMATDHLDYFREIERLTRAHRQFAVCDYTVRQRHPADQTLGCKPTPPDKTALPLTKFERRFRERGLPIYRLALRKTSPVK